MFIDTDGDGLSDEDEKIYKTDPLSIDTDGDNYTDYEEIYGSWNPLDGEYGPGQSQRTEIPPALLVTMQPRDGTEVTASVVDAALEDDL